MAASKIQMKIELNFSPLFKARLYTGCVCRALAGRDYESYAIKAMTKYVQANVKMSGPYINA